MNASALLNDEMTLEEKLAAIDKAMATAQINRQKTSPGAAPLDPSELTMCEGCQ